MRNAVVKGCTKFLPPFLRPYHFASIEMDTTAAGLEPATRLSTAGHLVHYLATADLVGLSNTTTRHHILRWRRPDASISAAHLSCTPTRSYGCFG